MRILLAEDTEDVGEAVAARLLRMGHAVDWEKTGTDAEAALAVQEYDLVVLDVMLPGKDGIALLSGLRARGLTTPVLMLTARDRSTDRIRGLDTGADDYLTKPFDVAELAARLRALIRRSARKSSSTLNIGGVEIDTAARVVRRDGEAVTLTAREYVVLEYLALHRGEVVTRTDLYEHLFDENDDTMSNILDVHVFNLRRKLGADLIVTRRGLGYSIE